MDAGLIGRRDLDVDPKTERRSPTIDQMERETTTSVLDSRDLRGRQTDPFANVRLTEVMAATVFLKDRHQIFSTHALEVHRSSTCHGVKRMTP